MFNLLIYAIASLFTICFLLDLASAIRLAWLAAAPVQVSPTAPAAEPVASINVPIAQPASTPLLPDPWTTASHASIPAASVAPVASPATPSPQLLLPPGKEISATITKKTPKPATDYNIVLTVAQLRSKAKRAGIKNFGRMKKNQLLAALRVG